MKRWGRRFGRRGALLFFNMALVFVSALLVLSNIRTRNELEESRRGFFTKAISVNFLWSPEGI